uniref:ATP synthase F0 subunit 8 n=1 Tax=Cheddikulama straminea TaxID=1603022 RepID=UPI00255208A8|nr:ATP synthase F0 subunit 8 [Cheddikulama straminea]WFD61185.1 ATP synthase F0 subunit 8 [Cheddikulama straminea]
MPQMMPLNWLMLFTFFSTLLIIFNIMNYYTNYNKSTSKKMPKTTSKTLNWKW